MYAAAGVLCIFSAILCILLRLEKVLSNLAFWKMYNFYVCGYRSSRYSKAMSKWLMGQLSAEAIARSVQIVLRSTLKVAGCCGS